MSRFFSHSGILAVSFLSVFFWHTSELAVYSVPLLGILTALYVILNFRKRSSTTSTLTVFLLNTSALLLILATGGLNSFLFFLLYFLCFYIAFTLVPETVLVFCAAVFFLFLPEAAQGNTLLNFTKLISFLLLAPLAYFFGREILSREKREKAVHALQHDTHQKADQIIQDVEAIVKNEGTKLKEEDIEALHDIVEKSKELEKKAA